MDLTGIDTCSLTELRRSPTACIARARDIGHPLFITRRGTAIAVLIPIEQYESMQREVEALAAAVQDAPTSASPRIDADERSERVDSLIGGFKGATVDEADYYRYLEEKYL